MKVVIISHRCYPWLGPRSHRTTELAKELAQRGHKVILYALLGECDYTDFSNKTGIVIKNLGTSKFGVPDNTGYSNKNIVYRAFSKFFGKYIEFPLIELSPMVKRVLKKEGKIDYLISIAHPHSIHWGAANYIKNNRDKIRFWVADCGDPFMGNPFHTPPFYFKRIEKKWCELCDFISIPVVEAKEGYYDEFEDKIKIIPQGYDFSNVKLSAYIENENPTFAYAGEVYKDLRDPTRFLDHLCTLDYSFQFVVYTKSTSYFENYKNELGDKLKINNYIPRDDLFKQLSKMDFLVNIKNDSGVQQPSKLIDYSLTKRPVIEITSAFNEKEIFNQFMNRNYKGRINLDDIEKYDINNVVNQFEDLYNLKHL